MKGEKIMNALDIFLIMIIILAVVWGLRSMHKDRVNRKGCLSCGGSCAGCSGCARTEDKK